MSDSLLREGHLEIWWLAVDGSSAWVCDVGPGKLVTGEDVYEIPEPMTQTFGREVRALPARHWKRGPTQSFDPQAGVGLGALALDAPEHLTSDLSAGQQ